MPGSHSSWDNNVLPAVVGTQRLLEATARAGSQLESLVVTLSVSALRYEKAPNPDYVYTEEDTTTWAVDAAMHATPKTHYAWGTFYTAGRQIMLQDLWKFRNEKKVIHINQI